MKPLEVLHVHSGNIYGGVETILATLARHAALAPDARYRFALGWAGRLSAELAATGASVSVVGAARLSRPWSVWASRAQLRRLLAREPTDVAVVHSSWAAAVYGPALARAGVPIVRWAHSMLLGPAAIERRAHKVRLSRILAVSEFVASHVRADYPGTPVECVYAPVTPPPASARAATRAGLGIAEGESLILHVGRMEIWKGQQVLLEALATLKDRNWRAAFAGGAQNAGEQAFLERLRATATSLGIADRVSWLGQRDDVRRLLDAADVVTLPSTAPEGLSIVLVEALYAGRAVVITDLGPIPEVVNETCARLVPPGDASALGGAIGTLLGDASLRERLGSAGAVRARAMFAPERQVPAIAACLRRGAGDD